MKLSGPLPEVMESSWRYNILPPAGDKVLVARLGEESVSMAYLNSRNRNWTIGFTWSSHCGGGE